MANSQNRVQVDFIANLLRKGGKRNDILAKFAKKWQKVSTRTFDRRLKSAEALIQSEQATIQAQAEQEVTKEIEVRKIEIMSVIERKETLTQIARGLIPLTKPIVVDKSIEYIEVVPDWMDRKNAIAELNKMDGAYAPTKFANTDSEGKDVQPQTTMTAEDAIKVINALKTGK